MNLVTEIEASDDYREYHDAFQAATGLPLSIKPASQLTLALCSKRQPGPNFCSMMTEAGSSCQTCQMLHRNIEREMGIGDNDSTERDAAIGTTFTEKTPQTLEAVTRAFGDGPRTFECFAGLCETMVPIKAGRRLIGFLKTGQVMAKKPTKAAFRKAMATLNSVHPATDISALENAYFATPVLPPAQYQAMTTLLKTYARHLSEIAEKLQLVADRDEPDAIRKAKAYLRANYTEPITLEDAARAAAMSPFHFSKRFKETVGIGFAEYLARLRIESCKRRLLDPNTRVMEAAFASGFQSMASFSRTWRRFEPDSPSGYRRQLRTEAP